MKVIERYDEIEIIIKYQHILNTYHLRSLIRLTLVTLPIRTLYFKFAI